MTFPQRARRECIDCQEPYETILIDALCPGCRKKADEKAAANVTCGECGKSKPPGYQVLCPECANKAFLASIEKWGCE